MSDLEHLRKHPAAKFSIEFVNGLPYTIVSYTYADSDFWKLPNATECRGIVFDNTQQCVSRPFEKFFSIGEREDTQLHSIPDAVLTLEKRDGSMIHPILQNTTVTFKTKASFYSDVALLANERVKQHPGVIELCSNLMNVGYTPIFEFTSKEYPVVLVYDSDPFVLLAARNNQTGEYLEWHKLEQYAEHYNVPLITKYNKSIHECIAESESLTDFEGYVFILKNKKRVKLKTQWYIVNHRVKTAYRERDAALDVAMNRIDDIKILLSNNNYSLDPLHHIETQVVSEFLYLENTVSSILNEDTHLTAKEFAMKHRGNKLFPLLMSGYNKKPIDYIKYWKNNYWKKYSLAVLYNKSF